MINLVSTDHLSAQYTKKWFQTRHHHDEDEALIEEWMNNDPHVIIVYILDYSKYFSRTSINFLSVQPRKNGKLCSYPAI